MRVLPSAFVRGSSSGDDGKRNGRSCGANVNTIHERMLANAAIMTSGSCPSIVHFFSTMIVEMLRIANCEVAFMEVYVDGRRGD